MSKKMMKRSLALGALMAFVITGSAMAETIELNGQDRTFSPANAKIVAAIDAKSKEVSVIGTGTETITLVPNNPANNNTFVRAWGNASATLSNINTIEVIGGTWNASGFLANSSGSTVTLDKIGNIIVKDVSKTNVFYTMTNGASVDVNAGRIELDGVRSGMFAEGGSINIETTGDFAATNLKSYGIMAYGTATKTGVVNLNAGGDVIIDTAGTGIYTYDGKGCSVAITSGGNVNITGGDAIVVWGDDSIVDINAPKAVINGGIYVMDGTLDITNVKDLVLQGLVAGNEEAAIQVEEEGILKVNTTEAGTLAIEGAKAGDTYKVVSGVGEETALWKDANLAYDRTTMIATSNHDIENKLYTVKYESFNDVTEVTEEAKAQFVEAVGGEEQLAVPNLVAEATGQGALMEKTAPGAKEFLAAISSAADMKAEVKAAVINAVAQLAEAGGNAGTAANVANNVSSVTTGRMSFTGGAAKGGKGVGLFEEGSGAAVWTQYMHGKDEATNMPMDGGATSYESNYDGIVLGVDFKKVGKFQSGLAFNYGEGDTNAFASVAKTKSDYDFWGIGYYGNVRNEDTNFIFDINYAKSDSDVSQSSFAGDIEASPETTTWSAGVKVEKLYQNNNVQIVPYTGLRYMSIDTDEYQSNVAGKALFNYAPERQDIWLLPLGVTIKQEVVNDNGWVVTPKVDLSYVWAFGDTDSNMSVSIPGIAASNDTLGFTVMDDGSFIGLVGIEAAMDDWTFDVSYSYQKGDYAESKKWFIDAKYTF